MYKRERELEAAEELYEFLQNNPEMSEEVAKEKENVYNDVDTIINPNQNEV